jgi:hypothetical protein
MSTKCSHSNPAASQRREEPTVRPRARTLLVALALASLATLVVAAPAHAVEAKQQTHLVAQFDSGHSGWIKIALEKDLSNNKARAHAAIWCQNASGTRVNCGAITYKASDSWLEVQHWDETYGWQYDLTLPLCAASTDCRMPNFGVENEYTLAASVERSRRMVRRDALAAAGTSSTVERPCG